MNKHDIIITGCDYMDIDEFINNILYSLFEKYNINSEFEKKRLLRKLKC